MIKAIGLFSGGLDSMLAMRVIHDQGIEVQGLNFNLGFSNDELDRLIRKRQRKNIREVSNAFMTFNETRIPIEFVNMSPEYLDMFHNPEYGYGKNVNPCIDCHILMLKIALQKMKKYDAHFVFTGEVLGQRPMSQQLKQLTIVAAKSGLGDLLLRPLSAQLLPPSLPERKGWVEREKLLGFSGRNRKPQMALAEKFGIKEYPSPAGGCVLTDPSYARKVRDLWKYNEKDSLHWEDYLLLRVGRHLRVNPELKVVVGRDESENDYLDKHRGNRIRIEVEDVPGPVVLIDVKPELVDDEMCETAARIAARYSDGRDSEDDLLINIDRENVVETIKVKPLKAEEVNSWLI